MRRRTAAVEPIAAARRTSCGAGSRRGLVDARRRPVPSSCSEAATVLLEPSGIEAIDCGRGRMKAPLARITSPGTVRLPPVEAVAGAEW